MLPRDVLLSASILPRLCNGAKLMYHKYVDCKKPPGIPGKEV